MILAHEITHVFAHRNIPKLIVDRVGLIQVDSDVEDAIWFTGRDWHTITWEEWQKRNAGFTFFSSEAFAYYLPSVLLLSLENQKHTLLVAQSLIWELDKSPSAEDWDPHFYDRFSVLQVDECEALKKWLLAVCEYESYKGGGIAAFGAGETFGRAFDTLDLLQKDVERRHLANG